MICIYYYDYYYCCLVQGMSHDTVAVIIPAAHACKHA